MDSGEVRKLEQEKEANKMRRKILRWLSPDDFEMTHETHFKKRFKNTGQWLLDDSRFINWRDGAQSSLLWCYGTRKLHFFLVHISELWRGTQLYPYIYINVYGIAGTGKTILAYGHPSSLQYK